MNNKTEQPRMFLIPEEMLVVLANEFVKKQPWEKADPVLRAIVSLQSVTIQKGVSTESKSELASAKLAK